MNDLIESIIVTAGSLLAGRELLSRFLGPSIDYFGESARDVVKKSTENLGRILAVAVSRAKMEQAGQVNPRILKHVVDEGRFVEDAFSAEYFGGLLASSRTSDGRDDTALPFVALVKSMSADQLRLHYVIYTLLTRYPFDKTNGDGEQFWNGLEVRIPGEELLRAMDLVGFEGESRAASAVSGLAEIGLIEQSYSLRLGGIHAGNANRLLIDAVILQPTPKGSRLFLRAHGSRGIVPEVITSFVPNGSVSEIVESVVIPTKARWNRSKTSLDSVDSVGDVRLEIEEMSAEIETTFDELRDEISKLRKKHTKAATKR